MFQTSAAKLIITVIALGLLATAAPGPKDIGSSKVFIAQNWTFDFGQELPPTFTFKTFGFQTTAAQNARMETKNGYPYTTLKDSLGNLLLSYTFSPASTVEKVSLRSFIDVDYSAPQPADATTAAAFLKGGPLSEYNAEMYAKAREVNGWENGSLTLAQYVKLVEWVHRRLTYDGFGFGNTVMNATWVFENRVGTCDEYSHLLVAMLRSLQTPSKFVAGYVCSTQCTQKENWGPHAWVEALIDGKWVASDPTFNEAILIDATHVKFAEGRDQDDVKEQLSAIAFNFPIKDVRLNRTAEVSLDDWKPFTGIFDAQLIVPEKTVGENSIETIAIRLTNLKTQPVAVPLSLVVPKELEIRSDAEALVFLPPSGSANYSWNVVFPQDLRAGFVYNFTIDVSTLGKTLTQNILAKKGGDTRELESLRINEIDATQLSNGVGVLIEIENAGNTPIANARVQVASNAGNASSTIALAAGEKKKVQVQLANPPEGSAITGTIAIILDNKQAVRPFNIRLIAPTIPQNESQNEFGGLTGEQTVLAAAVATVLILALALFYLGFKAKAA